MAPPPPPLHHGPEQKKHSKNSHHSLSHELGTEWVSGTSERLVLNHSALPPPLPPPPLVNVCYESAKSDEQTLVRRAIVVALLFLFSFFLFSVIVFFVLSSLSLLDARMFMSVHSFPLIGGFTRFLSVSLSGCLSSGFSSQLRTHFCFRNRFHPFSLTSKAIFTFSPAPPPPSQRSSI